MSRLQISDDFGGERLQTQARSITPTVQAAPPPQDTRWKSLANVFAQGAGLAETLAQQKEIDDKAAAKKWAQSMTVDQLGKHIDSGQMLPSQSPVFVGTVQHIWGVNSHEALARDVTSKLTTGELKFNSPQEADQYLTEARNTALAGKSEYAVSGFDKGYAQLRERVLDGVTRLNDKTWVDNAQVQAGDFLANGLIEVTSSDYKGSPQEAAAALLQRFQLLRRTKTLPDGAAKSALGDVVTRMAGSGNGPLLGAFLDSELDGVGSVRGFLGESKAMTLMHQATATYDQGQRQRIDRELMPWYEKADAGELDVSKLKAWAELPENDKYLSTATLHGLLRANAASTERNHRELQNAQMLGAVQASEYNAAKQVDAAIRDGRLWDVQGTNTPKVLTATGEVKDFDVRRHAEASLAVATRGLEFPQQVSAWAMNGIENPDWRNALSSGLLNLASVGVTANGKPAGQLNEAGRQSISLFRELEAVNPDYARQVAGETAHQRFSNIAFLMHLGRSDDDAAGLAAGVASGAVAGSDVDKLSKKVAATVDKLTEGSWWQPDWAMRMMGENTASNTAQVTGALRRYSSLLAYSGQYGDAETAVAAAYDYLARPEVSVRINGTRYLRAEMPQAPASKLMTQDQWFERYINKAVKPLAQHLSANDSDIRLEYDPTAQVYRPYVVALPLTDSNGNLVVVRRDQITAWYRAEEGRLIDGTVQQAKEQQRERVQRRNEAMTAGESAAEWARAIQEAQQRGTTPDNSKQSPPRKREVLIPPPVLGRIDGDWDYWKKQGASARPARPGTPQEAR